MAILNRDNSQTFTIEADEGYEILDVVVDGSSAGAITTYTFEDITEDHTIVAEFSPLA